MKQQKKQTDKTQEDPRP